MLEPKLRPANKADVIALNGKPYNESFRGITADMDGEILAIAGVLHSSPMQAFSVMKDEMRKYPKVILRAIKEFRKILDNYDGDDVVIYAFASKAEKNAPKLLERVGFTHIQDRTYQWPTQ